MEQHTNPECPMWDGRDPIRISLNVLGNERKTVVPTDDASGPRRNYSSWLSPVPVRPLESYTHMTKTEGFLITQELMLDEFFDNLLKHPVETESWKVRVKLWFMAITCQVRAFKFTTDEGVRIKGWIGVRDAKVYVTSIKL